MAICSILEAMSPPCPERLTQPQLQATDLACEVASQDCLERKTHRLWEMDLVSLQF